MQPAAARMLGIPVREDKKPCSGCGEAVVPEHMVRTLGYESYCSYRCAHKNKEQHQTVLGGTSSGTKNRQPTP